MRSLLEKGTNDNHVPVDIFAFQNIHNGTDCVITVEIDFKDTVYDKKSEIITRRYFYFLKLSTRASTVFLDSKYPVNTDLNIVSA